ncbi:MAG TPA: EamA family transporter [Candidatus Eisenbacteria bacterium]|nr:EamA family transporter [Candidatus Eisenbacteria bacterium]
MWFFLALVSAIFYSFRGILEKRIIHNVDKYVLGLAIRLFALPFFLIPFLFKPSAILLPHQLNFHFWLALIIVCFISTPLETILYYKALKKEEVTLILPILTLGPALTVLWGSVLLKEIPTALSLVGLSIIVFGIYSLKLDYAKEGLLEPFRHLKNNTAIRLMFVVMISTSLSSILDKVGVTSSNSYVWGIANYTLVSVSLGIIAFIKAKHSLHQLYTHWVQFFIIGIFVAAYTLLNFLALESGFVGYVSAIRASYIFFTMILGIIFLKEKDAKKKLLAGVFIVIGLVLIKIFG